MSILNACEIYYLNMLGEIARDRQDYVDAEKAYHRLKKITGQDFGRDAKVWESWLREKGLIRTSDKVPTQE